MKVNILLNTVQNLGDHGKEISIALDVEEYTTIQNMVADYLIDSENRTKYNDHIEIRVTK